MNRTVLSMFEGARSIWLWLRGLGAALLLLRDPNRLDEVFALDRATPKRVRALVVRAAREHGDGRRALAERHRIVIDMVRLRALPKGTFGRSVADFYDENGLTPSAIPSLEAVDDASYVSAHLYETHDVWHVATSFGTSVAEEIGLQAVYAAQMPGRLAPILVAGGLLQGALWVHDDFVPRMAAVARGYAIGKRAQPLFGVRWDEMWEMRVEDVRRRLGVSAAETTPSSALAVHARHRTAGSAPAQP